MVIITEYEREGHFGFRINSRQYG